MITCVLLVGLGSPTSPQRGDVLRYLEEFLLDERVIDIPAPLRHLLVRGIIAPFRSFSSSKSYKKIWTNEGSPLLVHTKAFAEKLRETLPKHHVTFAMRYQSPSLAATLDEIQKSSIDELIIFPLFPQYASATTGSIIAKVHECIKKWPTFPRLKIINYFYNNDFFIQALVEQLSHFQLADYDKILFSFHGLPERHLRKADLFGSCTLDSKCCQEIHAKNARCYKAQCHETVYLITKALGILPEQHQICFQSRLGTDKWTTPYTKDVIQQAAKEGLRRLLIMTPSFVTDCLETIYEIGIEYKEEFLAHGGQVCDLVPCLNSHPLWVKAAKEIIQQ